MRSGPILVLLITFCAISAPTLLADEPVAGTFCNNSHGPVQFNFFEHGQNANKRFVEGKRTGFNTLAVRACMCVTQQTHTNGWNNMPIMQVKQLVYRDVGATKSRSISVCANISTGEFEGYVDAGVTTCAEASRTTNYMPAPELDTAKGDLKVLAASIPDETHSCVTKNKLGHCKSWSARWSYSDRTDCHRSE